MNTLTDLPTETNSPNRMTIVEVSNLNKVYRSGFWLNRKIASLKNFSLNVYEGETFGMLGPNGAGKTTLLKILLGITRPTSGKAFLLGKPIGDRKVKQRIGYLPENAYYYNFLTGWEILEFTAGLFQIPKSIQKKRINELLDLVGLDKNSACKKQLRQYSKGMVQRIGMAQALINDPDVVFLDEPMSGLDPIGRFQVRNIILLLKKQGKTIFFNSHILADVEKICDRIAILARGELLCVGSLDSILGTTNSYQVVVQTEYGDKLKDWLDKLSYENDYWSGELQGNICDFINTVDKINGKIISINLTRGNLEDFFIRQLKERGIEFSR